jgi:hypothetical protein
VRRLDHDFDERGEQEPDAATGEPAVQLAEGRLEVATGHPLFASLEGDVAELPVERRPLEGRLCQ